MPTLNRRIRVFVSSTFRDMMRERDELMTHAWPELRRFCRERQVELVEVDLRWGIAEEQSTRKETLKLCLDEIRACRPFFIGLLGERYGWVPGDDAFTADLREEQPWLKDLHGKSVTELEILHGVLNNPEMAGRAFFYFRDPKYVESVPADKKTDFTAENAKSAEKLKLLKERIRARFGVPPSGGQAGFGVPPSVSPHATSPTKPAKAGTPNDPDRVNAELQTLRPRLHENYPDPVQLAAIVLEDLKAAIEAQFPIESIPDPLTREARDHEAFAETRRRTYIGRPDYFDRLNEHMRGDGPPLVVVGDSGSGKSALLANWVKEFIDRETREKQNQSGNSSFIPHPSSFVFQHYIGGTPDSAEHWRLMTRLIAEIKRWSGDPEELPRTHDDLLKTFPVWLAKARIKAERDGVCCILVLDALNQLEDRDHARLLGWLPSHPFTGALRLVVSTLPGDTLDAVTQRGWKSLRVEPLTPDERRRMIADYLQRFGKKLDAPRLERIAAAPAAANPLYLKILLDELRVTGTHERLDVRLQDYLAAPDIPALLKKVLSRYQHDYERDRPGLVSEALGLIWAARRGLTEIELLELLKPAGQERLPTAFWSPLRSALEDALLDRNGVLAFAHEHLRVAVERLYVPDVGTARALHLRFADYLWRFRRNERCFRELPWQLEQAQDWNRLKDYVADLEVLSWYFIYQDEWDLFRIWGAISQKYNIAAVYAQSLRACSDAGIIDLSFIRSAVRVARILLMAGRYEAALSIAQDAGTKLVNASDIETASAFNNLASILAELGDAVNAERLARRAVEIMSSLPNHDELKLARMLDNLAWALRNRRKLNEAEDVYRRSLEIHERILGPEHPDTSKALNNLGVGLVAGHAYDEARDVLLRALAIRQRCFGQEHPETAMTLVNLAILYQERRDVACSAPVAHEAIRVLIKTHGANHPLTRQVISELLSTDGTDLKENEES